MSPGHGCGAPARKPRQNAAAAKQELSFAQGSTTTVGRRARHDLERFVVSALARGDQNGARLAAWLLTPGRAA